MMLIRNFSNQAQPDAARPVARGKVTGMTPGQVESVVAPTCRRTKRDRTNDKVESALK
jgi:hypothetical protein